MCSVYSVEGCDFKLVKVKSDDDESDVEDGNVDDEDIVDTAFIVCVKFIFGVMLMVNVEDENCLFNFEDVK